MSNQNKKSGKGWLKTSLIVIGVLLLIGLLISFGWIAGIIWLIFFRKKLNDNPKKQKTTTIFVSVLSTLSFIIMVYSMATAPPALQEITISSDAEGQDLEIGKDYIINIAYTPEDASLNNLKYNIDGLSASFAKSTTEENKAILHTSSDGTVIVNISSGEIKSNSLEFNIVEEIEAETEITETETQEKDTPATIEEIKTSLVTLLESLIDESYKSSLFYACDASTDADNTNLAILSINLESPDFADQDSCINAVSPIISGVLDSEYCDSVRSMDFQMLVDGQIYYTIHIDELSTIASKDEIPNHLEVTPQQANDNTSSDASNSNSDSSSTSSDISSTPDVSFDANMVWIDNTGKKYHSKSSCSNMDAPYQVTKSEAEAMGKTACKKCY